MGDGQGRMPDESFRAKIERRFQQYNPAVASVDLSECRIDEHSVKWIVDRLKSLKGLHTLDLSWNSFGDAGATALAAHLRDLPNLTTLAISNNSIGDAGATVLAKHLRDVPNLTTLGIGDNSLGEAGATVLAKYLRDVPNLTTLGIAVNSLGEAGATVLAKYLRDVPNLTTLDISRNSIRDAGATALAAHLGDVPNLTTLEIGGNSIRDAGATALAVQLRDVPNLTTLDIRYNSLGDAGATALAKHLRDVPKLTTLDIRYNSLGDAGATALAKHLRDVPKLTTLDIRYNSLGDAGATALAAYLRDVPNLTTLGISDNWIGEAGATALAAHLGDVPNLTTLDISDNSIGEVDVITQLIRSYLSSHPPTPLQSIDIQGNPLQWRDHTPVPVTIRRITNPKILLARLNELADPWKRAQILMGRIVMAGPTEHGKTHLARWLAAKTEAEKTRLRQRQDRGPDNKGTWGADLLPATLSATEHGQPDLDDVRLRVMDCGGHPQQLQSHHNLYFSSWSRTVFVLCVRLGCDFTESLGEYHLGLLSDLKTLAISHRRTERISEADLKEEAKHPHPPHDPDYMPMQLVMVPTHADETPGGTVLRFPSQAQLQADYPLLSAIETGAWNALEGHDLAEIKRVIGTRLAKLPQLRAGLQTYVVTIMNAVEEKFERDGGVGRPPAQNSMSYAEFKELCDRKEVKDESERHVYILRTLDDLGVVVAPGCHDSDPHPEYRILNPNFVQDFLYERLLNPKPRPADGVIPAAQYRQVVQGLPKNDQSALESLMRRCLMAFEIKPTADLTQGWLVPDLLACNPEWPEWTKVLWTAHLKVEGFLNERIYFEFIKTEVDCIQRNPKGKLDLYRDGCVLEDGDAQARVRFDVRKRTIDIEVRGGTQDEAGDWCRSLWLKFKASTRGSGQVVAGPAFIRTPPPDLDLLVAEAMRAEQRKKADKAWSTIADDEKTLCKAILRVVYDCKFPPTDTTVQTKLKESGDSGWGRPAINKRILMLCDAGLLVRARNALTVTELGAIVLRDQQS